MSFEVLFKYKDGPIYPLDLKKAPDVSTCQPTLEKITGVVKQHPKYWSPSTFVGGVREPTSICKILSAATVTTAFIVAIVAMAIFWPNAAVIALASFLACIPAGFTWAGIADRKQAFQDRAECSLELYELGTLVGDNKEKLLNEIRTSNDKWDKWDKEGLTKLIKFFFPDTKF